MNSKMEFTKVISLILKEKAMEFIFGMMVKYI